MTTWADIATRAEAAEESCSTLDAEIWEMASQTCDPWKDEYTASLDACLELVAECAPNLPYVRVESFSDGWYASVGQHSGGPLWNSKQAKKAPLALLAAIARAMDAIGEKESAAPRFQQTAPLV